MAALRDLLHEIAEEGDTLVNAIDPLLQEANNIVQEVMRSPDQTGTAARLPPRLRALAQAIGDVGDRVSRRHFTLLPLARSLSVEESLPLCGAA